MDQTHPGTRLGASAAHAGGGLERELLRLCRYRLLIVDEVGHLPFDSDAANLSCQLVAPGYEHGFIPVTANRPSAAGGEIIHVDVVTAAMVDRFLHYAEVPLTGDSYRPRAGR